MRWSNYAVSLAFPELIRRPRSESTFSVDELYAPRFSTEMGSSRYVNILLWLWLWLWLWLLLGRIAAIARDAASCCTRIGMVCLSVGLLWAQRKRLNRSRCRLRAGSGGPRNPSYLIRGADAPRGRGNFGATHPLKSIEWLCCGVRQNGLVDRAAVLAADSSSRGLKKAYIRWHSRLDESIRCRKGWQEDDAAFRQNSLTTCNDAQHQPFSRLKMSHPGFHRFLSSICSWTESLLIRGHDCTGTQTTVLNNGMTVSNRSGLVVSSFFWFTPRQAPEWRNAAATRKLPVRICNSITLSNYRPTTCTCKKLAWRRV